ncbi:MAG: type II toxin-antitoxin system PemK/MazF family toxin [Ignavibacteriae bacterium]|nr:type II toxin-antitoxin system PemK/MazF family toxin [Ignavibacteriota bacterium]
MKNKIVLVQFPFDDLSSFKVRPAVCLTNTIGSHNHVIVGFITSKIPSDILPSDVILTTSDKDFEITGLRVSSTLRLHRLLTVSKSNFIRELGIIPERIQNTVSTKLKLLFEF